MNTEIVSHSVTYSVQKPFIYSFNLDWYSLGVFYWSNTLVSLVQLCIISTFYATLGYFFSEQHAVDGYSINWNRYGQFVFVVWLTGLFTQSLGQLIGSIILDNMEMAIVVSQMCYTFMIMLNDFFLKVEDLNNIVMEYLSSLASLKYITRYLIYIFYGIDRCNEEHEFSLVLVKHQTDPNSIIEYIVRVFITMAIIRLITFIYLYCKFNTFVNHLQVRLYSKGRQQERYEEHCSEKNVTITFRLMMKDFHQNRLPLTTEIDFSNFAETKSPKEKHQFTFIHNKVIIGWRNLSLYGSSSIFEIGNVSFNPTTKCRKIILQNLNGEFRFGTLNALMGTSGAGKTSLLKVLNGQYRTRLSEKTQFYLSKFTKIETCFITQDVSGHLLPGLTAKQMLIYASRLKNRQLMNQKNTESKENKPRFNKIDHEKIALNLLSDLNLEDTANTKVDQCSGGERKRLALALELTTFQMPNLICIDEPTSGLDSNSAEIVSQLKLYSTLVIVLIIYNLI